MNSKTFGVILLLFISAFNAQGQDKLYSNTFFLGDVQLLDGPFKKAQDLNIKTLLQYDINRLLAPYQKAAGLATKAGNYPNWESDGLDGHIAGHYLSAMAINFASTGDLRCKDRMESMINELKKCQEANSKDSNFIGYLGGGPNAKTIWLKIKNGNPAAIWDGWAPWYNIHKMFAGLRDAWLYAGNETSKTMFLKLCDWGISTCANLSNSQMEAMLANEHGGMNEVYADAYQITGESKYLDMAKRFSHKVLLDPLAAKTDNLDNIHANTQIPKAIGFERIGELSHDKKYTEAGSFFWETVTTKRTLAFGGNSRKEFFPSAAACEDFINDVEGPESCNTYNMLKLTEDLFRVNPSAKYADFYEKAVYNHILSTQHPEHGGYVYFTPARPRHYRVYSAPNEAMWCCVGSGMENHGKYNQFIYTHKNDSLYVNLFIASELNWKEKGIKITQETKFPYEEQTKLKVTGGSSKFKLMVRYPSWVKDGDLKIIINGKPVSYNVASTSYIAIDRRWKTGDEVQILLPMHNTVVQLPNVANYFAIMHGPILLGAKTGTEDLKGLVANDSRWGHISSGERLPIDKAPIIIEDDFSKIADKLIPVKDKPLTFIAPEIKLANPIKVELMPFFQIHDSRYMIYWMTLTNNQYRFYVDSISNMEKKKLDLQKRTIDFVAPGEQQPEADHFIQKENSTTGNKFNEFWRDARNGGFFSYKMSTNSETDLSLIVRYCGAEQGSRKFDIYIDDEKLITEDNTGRWTQAKFQDVEYSIPNSMIKGKTNFRIKFQALLGNATGGVYYIRLVRTRF